MCKKAATCLVVTILVMLFILFMVFCPPRAPAAEIHGSFEAGTDTDSFESFVKIDLSFDHDIWIFNNSLYGGIECWFILDDTSGHPFLDIYKIGYRINYKDFFVDLHHWCPHAVYSGSMYGDLFEGCKRFLPYMSTISVGVKW